MELKCLIFVNGHHTIVFAMCLNGKNSRFSFTNVFNGKDVENSSSAFMEVDFLLLNLEFLSKHGIQLRTNLMNFD